ncbi:LOW QUALITY PROTEIN: Uma2 family endonuclease [Dulcicalothrix desertica PCC 7102]|nr:LOW QUALITY PROTEIN: Uma2 family endonuclease [Dulcicalothrix desertica PCC 7102]
MTITRAKWTVDDYHQMIEKGILSGRRVELLKGEIVEMAPEREPHAVYSSSAVEYLRLRLGERATIREGHPITLPNDSEPEPDIAVVVPPLAQYLAHHPYVEDIYWVVEYSNTTLEKDLGAKKEAYALSGIREYWVVDLQNSQLIVFRNPSSNQYLSEVKLTTGFISPQDFPNIQLEVQKMFSV